MSGAKCWIDEELIRGIRQVLYQVKSFRERTLSTEGEDGTGMNLDGFRWSRVSHAFLMRSIIVIVKCRCLL